MDRLNGEMIEKGIHIILYGQIKKHLIIKLFNSPTHAVYYTLKNNFKQKKKIFDTANTTKRILIEEAEMIEFLNSIIEVTRKTCPYRVVIH